MTQNLVSISKVKGGLDKKSIKTFVIASLTITLFFLLIQYSYATNVGSGLGILEAAGKYVNFLQALFKYICMAAIIAMGILLFQKQPIWIYAFAIMIFSAVIANLDKIVGAMSLSGSCLIL